MSIVERALKKLQDSAPAAKRPEARASAVPQEGFGTVVMRAAEPPRAAQPAFHPLKHIDINRDALRTAGLLPPEHQAREIADEYRTIKRPLIANAFGNGGEGRLPHGQVIAVASALPGEGKTFNSINLAFSMSLERDMSVLLVDADVAKPHVSRIFGVREEPGLIDLLTDPQRTLEEAILATNIPGLCILPAGKSNETATELLASSRMREIVEKLETQDPNRIVLFDCPPLLLTTESRALATAAGQVVLVVRADETPRNAVMEAIELIGEGKWIGLVLNQSATQSAGGYYGFGQRYGEESARENVGKGTADGG